MLIYCGISTVKLVDNSQQARFITNRLEMSLKLNEGGNYGFTVLTCERFDRYKMPNDKKLQHFEDYGPYQLSLGRIFAH